MKLVRPVLAVLLTLAAVNAPAAGKLGDTAAALHISDWAKGQPVDLVAGKGKQVYVVEFWATWCGPCRTSIPHLTEMQKKFKDQGVVFIGVTGEEADAVKPFVEKMGDKMDYVVAVDDDNKTSAAYMEAFGVNGIPHAFVVDKAGLILWHGHPMDNLERVVEQVVAGKFDLNTARKEAESRQAQGRLQQAFGEYLRLAKSGREPARAEELGLQLVRDVSDDPEILNQFAWVILTEKRIKNRDVDLALAAAQAAVKASKEKDPLILQTYARALFDLEKVAEAVRTQKMAVQVADDKELRSELEKVLQQYEAKLAGKK